MDWLFTKHGYADQVQVLLQKMCHSTPAYFPKTSDEYQTK